MLNRITSTRVCELLTQLGLDTRITTLGHVQRGGTAVAYDRLLSTLQGVEAVRTVLEATPESPSYMIGMAENKIVRRPLVDAVKQTQEIAKCIERKDFTRAMELRGSEMCEYWEAYMSGVIMPNPENFVPPAKVSIWPIPFKFRELISFSECEWPLFPSAPQQVV
jgi:6-phosphofructokinase 1